MSSMRRFAALWATAIVVSSLALWWARDRNLETGLPCDARGPQGCGIDPPYYTVWGLMVAAPFAIGATVLWFWLRRRGGIARVLVVGTAVGWLVLYAVVFDAVRYGT